MEETRDEKVFGRERGNGGTTGGLETRCHSKLSRFSILLLSLKHLLTNLMLYQQMLVRQRVQTTRNIVI